jgi:hypothetical protein
MAVHRNKLWPDTHGPDTFIEYEWDDANPEVHTPIAVRLFGVDQPPGQLIAAMNKVYGEASRRSYSIADLLTYLESSEQVAKKYEDFSWVIDPDTGVVTITVSGVTTQQRNRARTFLANKYGNLVVLNVV